VQGVLQRGGSLSVGDVLAAGPAANGFGIFHARYDRDQPFAEEFLEGGGTARPRPDAWDSRPRASASPNWLVTTHRRRSPP